jgi:hypothetical protein
VTLLSLSELRQFVSTSLEDEPLQLFLDAAEQAINSRYGELGDAYGVEETIDGGRSYIFLRRRASSIDAITETDGLTETELEADDWRLRGDGVSVLRLGTGTNPRSWWGAPVVVNYTLLDDEAERKRVQQALVKLELGFVPGNIEMEQIGAWLERRSADGTFDYAEEREKILDSLGGAAQPPGFA